MVAGDFCWKDEVARGITVASFSSRAAMNCRLDGFPGALLVSYLTAKRVMGVDYSGVSTRLRPRRMENLPDRRRSGRLYSGEAHLRHSVAHHWK